VDFMKMPATEIHVIARDRHIVVENILQEDFSWSHESLSQFGLLSQLREIQGKCPVPL
jgi:hypothetical protein